MNTTAPTPSNSQPERWHRPVANRMLAGVAAAYADRLGLDVGIVRILFVVSTFFGGFGLVVYAATWALLPEEGSDRSPAQGWFGKPS